MTEQEAKQKWCPAVRITPESESIRPTTNRCDSVLNDPLSATRCLGSECMAWRWGPQEWEMTNSIGGTWRETKSTDGYGRSGKKLPQQGWCGLAGEP